MDRDTDKSHFGDGGTCAVDIVTVDGGLLGTNKTVIYNAY